MIVHRTLANCLQNITTMDHRIGRVLEMMTQHGYQGNLLFLYTIDHGSEWLHCKWTIYDTGTRVPMIARWFSTIQSSQVSAAVVSNIDLLPTLIEIAGGEVPTDLDGQSFKQVLLG